MDIPTCKKLKVDICCLLNICIKTYVGIGEMVQWLHSQLISTGPRFNSQYLYGISQLSVTPVPGDLTPFSDPYVYQVYTQCGAQTCMQAKH